MSISMKSLVESSEDEEEIIINNKNSLTKQVKNINKKETYKNENKNYKPIESNISKQSNIKISRDTHSVNINENYFVPEKKKIDDENLNIQDNINNEKLSHKKQLSLDLKNDEAKSHWLKEQVSGSFKRLSQRISPANSLDNSLSESFDEAKRRPDEEKEPKINKTMSDTDLSKRTWLKGQLTNYISKSKNYYYRNQTNQSDLSDSENDTITIKNDIHSIKTDDDDFEISNNMATSSPISIEVPTSSQVASPEIPTPSVKATHKNSAPTINISSSFASDDNYLPFISPSHMEETTFKPISSPGPVRKSMQQTKTLLKNTKKDLSKLSKNRDAFKTSKLTFSELLTSQKSLTSPVLSPSSPPESQFEKMNKLNQDDSIEELANVIIQEDLKNHRRSRSSTQITFLQLWFLAMFLYAYMSSFLPSYFAGFVTGCLFTFFVFCFIIWLSSPSADLLDQYKTDLKSFLVDNAKKEGTPLEIKGLPKAEVLQKPRDLKSWLGLGSSYVDYDFKKELNQDVYSVLHNQMLYLFINKENLDIKTSKIKVSRKPLRGKKQRALLESLNAEGPAFVFEHQWTIDVSKCTLILKPDDLPVRRMWNKKYPIKLIIPKNLLVKRKINLSLEELTLSMNDILEGVDIHSDDTEITKNLEDEEIFLFGNTGREKEDWFYRMQLCVKPLRHQFGVNESNPSIEPQNSYPHYMVELITESEKVMQLNQKGKKMEPYLAWLNIFLGRAFWDFWHDQYWTNKLHQKIQTRLSKINTPPFITNITLKALDCGHNIPIIHKGSVPVLDEYGVWTDLQITYKGCFTLTLETQLNVDYYVELLSSIAKKKAGVDPKDHSQLSKLTKMSEISNDALGQDDHDIDDVSNFHEELQNVYFEDEPEDHLDPLLSDPRTKAFLDSRAGKKVVGLVGWLAKSKLAKRVAETDFAKKAYEKAYEKFRKMPIILKVEIQSVRGNLAVNIPPPPTNRLWFGFRGNPVIFITATPKVGDKQVRLTYLTSWIEKKLKEEFKKYLVLPSMQDISIKLMDSQLSSLCPDRPSS